MSDDKLEIEVIVNGKKAIAQLGGVEKSTDKLGKQTEKTDKKIKDSTDSIKTSWIAVGAAIAAVTGIVGKSVAASNQQIKAETALKSALKANYTQGQSNINMWREFASAMQNMSLYGDEAVLQQVAMLKSMQLTDKQIEQVIKASMDLSAATGDTLESSVRNLSKTFSGLGGELAEKIPQLRELTKEQMENGEAVRVVSELYKGQAEAIAGTDYGKFTQSINELGDALEGIGDVMMTLGSDLALPELFSTLSGGIKSAVMGFYNLKASVYEFDIAISKKLGLTERVIELQEELDETTSKIDRLKNETKEGLVIKISGGRDPYKELLAERKEALEELNKSWDLTYPLQQIQKEADAIKQAEQDKQKAMEKTRQRAEEISGNIADSIVDSAMTGKLSFADMAQSMIREMMRVMAQRLIMQAMTSSFLGGIFHTGGEVKHTGGMIGANLPTYHTGMRTDERVAKLQVGESVINRHGTTQNKEAIDAMNKGYKVGSNGGGGNVTTAEINFNVQAIDAASFNSFLVGNKQTIEGIINNSLRTNGSVRKTIKMVG